MKSSLIVCKLTGQDQKQIPNRKRGAQGLSRITMALLLAGSVSSSPPLFASIDPPGCDLASGGSGNASTTGLNFFQARAHVGDTVTVQAQFGLPFGACNATNVTGTVYFADGTSTNFVMNKPFNVATDTLVKCPANAADTGTDIRCEPRPYKYVVKAANEGTTVQSPDGKVVRPGVAKTVGAVVEILGLSHSSAITDEPLFKGDAAGISIVHPCIRVFKEC